MRIAGEMVNTDERIEVFNTYDNSLVSSVPRGGAPNTRGAHLKLPPTTKQR
jgi:hypothetical protein